MRSAKGCEMKRALTVLIALLMALSGCAAAEAPADVAPPAAAAETERKVTAEKELAPAVPEQETERQDAPTAPEQKAEQEAAPAVPEQEAEQQDASTAPEESAATEASPADAVPQEQPTMEEPVGEDTELQIMCLSIAGQPLTVEWADNASADALRELLEKGPVTVELSQYGGFEQVGALGTSLPRNDVQTTTEPGDIVLYSGNQIVMFYGSNSWAYTRLGRITGMSREDLTALLGVGGVTATLSLADDDG